MIDAPPDCEEAFASWILATKHLNFIERDSQSSELLVHAHGSRTVILSAVIEESRISSLDQDTQDDLLDWAAGPQSYRATYMLSHDGSGPWIEHNQYSWGSTTLKGAYPLVFLRHFTGSTPANSEFIEILQEYIHITDSRWMSEESAYCRFNRLGDLDHIISVTPSTSTDRLSAVTFKRKPLDKYLDACDSVLVRLFSFELHKDGEYPTFQEFNTRTVNNRPDLLYLQSVLPATAGHVHGVQIIRPEISQPDPVMPIDFLAFDWRHKTITNISTDPSATTSYFAADQNNLPFDTSPAFFRPDVLQKYKDDREKYTVYPERISCRGGWSIRYDVNEASQIHAYISQLRRLPYHEMLYWKSFNERPKVGISERAYTQDFEGRPFLKNSPFEDIIAILREWLEQECSWWEYGNGRLLGS